MIHLSGYSFFTPRAFYDVTGILAMQKINFDFQLAKRTDYVMAKTRSRYDRFC